MGTQKLKKVPMGTGSPKWGPMWAQCSSTNALWGAGHSTHTVVEESHFDPSRMAGVPEVEQGHGEQKLYNQLC